VLRNPAIALSFAAKVCRRSFSRLEFQEEHARILLLGLIVVGIA
jgi:hypothetical protein